MVHKQGAGQKKRRRWKVQAEKAENPICQIRINLVTVALSEDNSITLIGLCQSIWFMLATEIGEEIEIIVDRWRREVYRYRKQDRIARSVCTMYDNYFEKI
jgi:hypothetical protein